MGRERVDDAVASRRRVIDMAMSRRAHMTVGVLQHLLHRLDIEVPSETVVADLDALGYDVEDGDRVVLAVGSDERGDHDRGDPQAHEDGVARRWRRAVPILAGLAVLLAVAAVAVGFLGARGDDAAPEARRGIAVSEGNLDFESTAINFGLTRYRAGADVVLCVLAAVALVALAQWLGRLRVGSGHPPGPDTEHPLAEARV